MKIHRVITKVRPKKEHPLFWEMQFGYLCLWVIAENEYAATDIAKKFEQMHPLEVVGDARMVASYGPGDVDPSELFAANLELARSFGFSWKLVVARTGADEDGFEAEFESGTDGLGLGSASSPGPV